MKDVKGGSDMDEMKLKLSTKFMRNLIAKIISKLIRKKLGLKIDIQINELEVEVIDGQARISTSVDGKIDNKEFMKLLQSIDTDEES